ncbi:hypothetical protein PF005_g11736 [Phytophthora fragariae]|uniref:CBF1-interacting co-repressor CIR N-terminal domain-containing protein n=1 Tax=Phytophthora fragariae TaxID=53985 RepID=A0A6A3UC17_9STRA|nr:hypothetical protein PF011_g10395 [Phytophthora fragariae]KAE9110715.1 hypothetical protein PF007_g11774 [Phytophthora fragariae]KAE9110968.1 hypothetical protein PF010_g10990 [Phytophthora fragariae]KAE9144511.1 hypothetical protein PF006_g10574 [Phytophthora fragariae]KAE9209677.1 hypothetical protein PF005_g11736 [Phytophthora fragariae]
MSLQFLGQKSWHPASKANQKRIWVAEQRAKEQEQREREKAKEVRKAAEALQAQQAAAAAGDGGAARRAASQQVNFLYAAPPGLPETKEQTQQTQGEEDEAVREFRRRAERRGDPQRKLERYVGRRAEETLTIKDQVERFPMLKDAPVEGKYTETIRVNFNPVGLRLRNVRCIRCGEWGHQSGDRECKLRDHNPNDATRQRWEDPVTEINKLKSAKQELVFRRGALPLEMQEATEEYEILQSDDEAVEAAEDAFLATLSSKQKRKLMKKLQKDSRGDRSSSDSDSDSDVSSSRRHRSKKRNKSSKHKRKHKHKYRSRGRPEDEREGSKEYRNTRRCQDASLSPRRDKKYRQSCRSRSRSRSKRREGQRRSSRT